MAFFRIRFDRIQELKATSYFKLTGDVVAIFGAPPWIGFFSQAGLLLWAAAASFSILAFAVLQGHSNQKSLSCFLLATASLSTLLLIDDTYLLHEQVLPHFGIPQIFILCGYIVLGFSYVWCFRQAHLTHNYILLLAAMGGLGLSLLSDATSLYLLDTHLFETVSSCLGLRFGRPILSAFPALR